MSAKLVGQEIEAYCGKCKENTIHSITSLSDDKIEKVMCNVCMAYHKFKKPLESTIKPLAKKVETKDKAGKKKTTRPRRSKWTRILEETDFSTAIAYKMDQNYDLAMAIHHKTFGPGIVKNVIDNQKIEVLFHDGEKMLVQNYQL